eukprot:768291-Hanusia_phi.AAC.8
MCGFNAPGDVIHKKNEVHVHELDRGPTTPHGVTSKQRASPWRASFQNQSSLLFSRSNLVLLPSPVAYKSNQSGQQNGLDNLPELLIRQEADDAGKQAEEKGVYSQAEVVCVRAISNSPGTGERCLPCRTDTVGGLGAGGPGRLDDADDEAHRERQHEREGRPLPPPPPHAQEEHGRTQPHAHDGGQRPFSDAGGVRDDRGEEAEADRSHHEHRDPSSQNVGSSDATREGTQGLRCCSKLAIPEEPEQLEAGELCGRDKAGVHGADGGGDGQAEHEMIVSRADKLGKLEGRGAHV